MANHLETLISQYYDWQGWIVKKNVRVGRRRELGGYDGELDVVVYNPATGKVIHYEPSTDASSWEKRAEKYEHKFQMGRRYISKEVLPWLAPDFELEQIAVFFHVPAHRRAFQGAKAISIDELVGMIRDKIKKEGRVGKNAIPEQYDLLRTIQLLICGYMKPC